MQKFGQKRLGGQKGDSRKVLVEAIFNPAMELFQYEHIEAFIYVRFFMMVPFKCT